MKNSRGSDGWIPNCIAPDGPPSQTKVYKTHGNKQKGSHCLQLASVWSLKLKSIRNVLSIIFSLTLLKLVHLQDRGSFSVSGKIERGLMKLPREENVFWMLTKYCDHIT